MCEKPPTFLGEAGEPVPTVDPEDLKAVFEVYRDEAKNNPDVKTLAMGVFAQVCKPGADTQALWFRCAMLQLFISIVPEAELSPWVKDGLPDDAMFREMARIPMEWMGVGVSRRGPPFDLDELMRRVTGTAA